MKFVRVVLVLAFLFLMGACSGSKAPAVGTPDWLWAAARDSYLAGDYEKATDHLLKIEKGNSPYVERARAWRLLIEAGSANAQVELAKAYSDGWANTRTEKTAYLRRKEEHLKEARRHAIDLFEGYGPLAQQLSEKPVVLEFPFPGGNAAYVTDLDRIYKGMSVAEEVKAATSEKMMRRGVVRAIDAALTKEDDSAGAQEALKAGRAEVPAARFLMVMAASLNRAADVFDRKNLNEPNNQKMFRGKAMDAVKRVLELQPDADTAAAAKKLQAEIEKQTKEAAKPRRA